MHVEADVLHRLEATERLRQALHRQQHLARWRHAPAGGMRLGWRERCGRCRHFRRHRGRCRRALEAIAQRPEHALRRHQNDDNDGDAVDHALDAGYPRAEFGVEDFADRDQHGGADQRSPHRADAAEHRHRQGLRRDQHAEYRRRRDHQQHHGIERADRAGDRTRQRDGAQLPRQGIDARGLRRRLVLLDRQQRHAEPRSLDGAGDEHDSEQHGERDQGVEPRIGKLHIGERRVALDRQRQLLVAEPLEHVEHRQRVGQHRQREVVAAQAERRKTDQEAGHPADHGRDRDQQPWREIEVELAERRRVGAEPEEGGVAKGYQTGVAGQDVP